MAVVTCARCGRQAEGLERSPLSGQLGRDVLSRVCADCWQEWTQESFRIINHYGLQPVQATDRERLRGMMREYFKLG